MSESPIESAPTDSPSSPVSSAPPSPAVARSFRQLNHDVFQVVAQSPFLFVLLPALAWFPANLLIEYIIQQTHPSGLSQEIRLYVRLNNLAEILVGLWVTAAQVYAMKELAAGRQPTVKESLRQGLSLWGRIFAVGLSAGWRIVIGLVLGIVPGIYFMVRYAFVTQVAIFEDVDASRALVRSERYVEGHSWRVFGYCLGYFLLYIPLVASTNVVTFAETSFVLKAINALPFTILISLLTIFLTLFYADRRAQSKIGSFSAAPPVLPPAGLPLPQHPRPAIGTVAAISVGTLLASFVFIVVAAILPSLAGNEALERQDYPAAVKHLTKALYWAQDDAGLHNGLGVAYQMTGDLQAAERHLQQAVKLDDRNALYHLNLARVLTQLGRYSEARNAAQAARRLGHSEQAVSTTEADIEAAKSSDPQ